MRNFGTGKMEECLRGIVLRTYNYNDKNAIVKVYTDNRGLLSFLLPQSNSKAAKMRRALFQPLALVEIEAVIMPGRDLFRIKNAHCLDPLISIRSNPIKGAICLFLTEILSRAIIEQEQNAPLFSFIAGSIRYFDRAESGIANFHICFLFNLGVFIGIEPDTENYAKGAYFDMENGVFTNMRPLHQNYLEQAESELLMNLTRINYSNMHLFQFSGAQRTQLLDMILRYYKLHNSSLGEVKSLATLREMFE